MPFVDFAKLKDRVTIEQAVAMLGLKLTPHGDQLRGPCPICKSGGDRALVITKSKGLHYCFAAKTGGDLIALVAHIRGVSPNEAAQLIAQQFGTGTVPGTGTSTVRKERATVPPEQKAGLNPLTYLEPAHEAVQALGISQATCEAFQAGYAPKGVLRGRLAVPVRNKAGELVAYVGIAVSKEQSPALLFHNFDPHGVIFNADRVAEGGDLFVCRDPLAVLLAVENGIPAETLVSFLAPITAQSLEMLASLMDEKRIETLELC
jgi:DNA primase